MPTDLINVPHENSGFSGSSQYVASCASDIKDGKNMDVTQHGKSTIAPVELNSRKFEFDYSRNIIIFGGEFIRLSPHEADILQVLLNNRGRPSPMGLLIQRVYGASEPEAAAASIRVAIHSLRKKIEKTGMRIQATPKVGYEVNADHIPELNRRLSDKILIALNVARATEQPDIVVHLQAAYDLAESKRRRWLSKVSDMSVAAPLSP
jgi:DNA-binding winged helix-turn-helix (wHTH) protein